MVTLKYKSSNINDNTANDATERPATLENEATPDTAILSATATATTSAAAAAAYVISPDAHFLSSGLKLDTEIF